MSYYVENSWTPLQDQLKIVPDDMGSIWAIKPTRNLDVQSVISM